MDCHGGRASWPPIHGCASIAAHPDDFEDALAEYERALFPRSAQFAAESDRNHKLLFGDNTPDGLLKLLTGQDP